MEAPPRIQGGAFCLYTQEIKNAEKILHSDIYFLNCGVIYNCKLYIAIKY